MLFYLSGGACSRQQELSRVSGCTEVRQLGSFLASDGQKHLAKQFVLFPQRGTISILLGLGDQYNKALFTVADGI